MEPAASDEIARSLHAVILKMRKPLSLVKVYTPADPVSSGVVDCRVAVPLNYQVTLKETHRHGASIR